MLSKYYRKERLEIAPDDIKAPVSSEDKAPEVYGFEEIPFILDTYRRDWTYALTDVIKFNMVTTSENITGGIYIKREPIDIVALEISQPTFRFPNVPYYVTPAIDYYDSELMIGIDEIPEDITDGGHKGIFVCDLGSINSTYNYRVATPRKHKIVFPKPINLWNLTLHFYTPDNILSFEGYEDWQWVISVFNGGGVFQYFMTIDENGDPLPHNLLTTDVVGFVGYSTDQYHELSQGNYYKITSVIDIGGGVIAGFLIAFPVGYTPTEAEQPPDGWFYGYIKTRQIRMQMTMTALRTKFTSGIATTSTSIGVM